MESTINNSEQRTQNDVTSDEKESHQTTEDIINFPEDSSAQGNDKPILLGGCRKRFTKTQRKRLTEAALANASDQSIETPIKRTRINNDQM